MWVARATPASREQEPETTPDQLKAGCETQNSQRLLEELTPCQRAEQISCDARDGFSAFIRFTGIRQRQLGEQLAELDHSHYKNLAGYW